MRNHNHLEQVQKPLQKLVISKEMQRALHLLQLPVLELSAAINEEIEQNPLLESLEADFSDFRNEKGSFEREESDPKAFLENVIAVEKTLFDHLLSQASEKWGRTQEYFLAKFIIGNLDEWGFLSTPLEEIAFLAKCPPHELEPILASIKTFDPIGIGAKNLQESLLIQLKNAKKEKDASYQIVENHFEDMLKNRLPLIGKALSLSPKKIKEIIEKEIVPLNLHPGKTLPHSRYKELLPGITPDVTIKEDLTIVVNEEKIPKIRFSSRYLRFLEDETIPKDTKDYIKEKYLSGKWLIKNLSERNTSLERITTEIVKRQKPFFQTTQGKLRPFTMKEVASTLSLNESTVVRAVANKYLYSPRGTYPLRFFFTHGYTSEKGEGVAPHTIQETILQIISHENKKSPLSDDSIAKLLKTKGFPIARRTVAKYRTLLNLGSTTERKIH